MNILDSLIDGALALPDKGDADALIAAIVRFKRTGEEPEGLSPTARAMWIAIRPVAGKNRSMSENGRTGGTASASSRRASKAESKQPSKSSSKPSSKRSTELCSSSPSYSHSSSTGVEGSGEEGGEPPTADEVRAYFAANCLRGSADEFADHFAAQGWVRGNGMPVADWRAAARQWSRRQAEFDASRPPEQRQPDAPIPVAENAVDWEAEYARATAGGAS